MSTALGSWIDGVPGAALPADDRGLQYGDQMFETVLVRSRRALSRCSPGAVVAGLRASAFPLLRQRLAWRSMRQWLARRSQYSDHRDAEQCAAARVRRKAMKYHDA
jgi:hypothetical protein